MDSNERIRVLAERDRAKNDYLAMTQAWQDFTDRWKATCHSKAPRARPLSQRCPPEDGGRPPAAEYTSVQRLAYSMASPSAASPKRRVRVEVRADSQAEASSALALHDSPLSLSPEPHAPPGCPRTPPYVDDDPRVTSSPCWDQPESGEQWVPVSDLRSSPSCRREVLVYGPARTVEDIDRVLRGFSAAPHSSPSCECHANPFDSHPVPMYGLALPRSPARCSSEGGARGFLWPREFADARVEPADGYEEYSQLDFSFSQKSP
ncbi:hypothetical protein AB1Y20_022441 [Prymnesium parvum]|uniref:Uncharacterized protein n=1 Tax=Prymnesium parvum TaxID=97485 RepID=A0AB34JGX7_PRYPA